MLLDYPLIVTATCINLFRRFTVVCNKSDTIEKTRATPIL